MHAEADETDFISSTSPRVVEGAQVDRASEASRDLLVLEEVTDFVDLSDRDGEADFGGSVERDGAAGREGLW